MKDNRRKARGTVKKTKTRANRTVAASTEQRIVQIHEYMIMYLNEHGYVPSIREIAEGVGLKSTSSVQQYLEIMFERKIISTDAAPRTPRAFRLDGYKLVKMESRLEEEDSDNLPNVPFVQSQ